MGASEASELISQLSVGRSMNKGANLKLMAPDGRIDEINSQGSAGTSPGASPEKLQQVDPTKSMPASVAEGIAELPWAHSFSVADAAVTTASRRFD